ncbi:MAG: ankyrin repeat domain-containing protein [Proteobacteria bacterium]|nr:ankyrin repeat domain-containing protein [Pseudomonadota bacterium]
MLPLIPIIVAVTSAAVLVKRKIVKSASDAKRERLLKYTRQLDIPIDAEDQFNPNTLLSNGMPLLFDVMSDRELFTGLLEFGANPDICNASGTPAIIYAMKHENAEEIIAILLKHGANPNAMDSEGKTAIFRTSSETILKMLKKAGADFNAVDCTGKTSLFYSLKSLATTEALIKSGTNVNALDGDGKSILEYVNGNFEIVKLLEENGLDMDSAEQTWESYQEYINFKKEGIPKLSLFEAVDSNNILAAKLAIERGANLKVRDTAVKNWNLIHLAIYKDNPEMIEILAKAGVDINDDNDGQGITPLTKALYNQKFECFKKLLELGADPAPTRSAITYSEGKNYDRFKILFKQYDKKLDV